MPNINIFERTGAANTFSQRVATHNLPPGLLVANSILNKSFLSDTRVSHLKLQKLIYFVYKKYLQDTGHPLFAEYFEVWTYGPVLRSVYNAFKHFGHGLISEYAYDTPSHSNRIFIVSKKDVSFQRALDWVWSVYGNVSANRLVELTHEKDSAWSVAKNKRDGFLDDEVIALERWAF